MKTHHLIPILFLAAFCTVSAQTNNTPDNSNTPSFVELMISNANISVQQAEPPQTPDLTLSDDIYSSARYGHSERVKALLNENPDLVNIKDTNGLTPLQWAADFNQKEVVELLLANKADINATNGGGATPLAGAATFGHKDVVALLLANKADVNAKNYDGKTPLDLSVHNLWPADSDKAMGCKDVAELLRQHGGKE